MCLFANRGNGEWAHTHTHTESLFHTHAQLLWLVSICVYICACICWHPPYTQALAGTHTRTLASITFGVCLPPPPPLRVVSLSLCVCVECVLWLFFYGRGFGPSHLCLFSYFCGLPLFAYISTTFVVSPASVRALDTCQNMTSLPTTTYPSCNLPPHGHNILMPHALLESTFHSLRLNARQQAQRQQSPVLDCHIPAS